MTIPDVSVEEGGTATINITYSFPSNEKLMTFILEDGYHGNEVFRASRGDDDDIRPTSSNARVTAKYGRHNFEVKLYQMKYFHIHNVIFDIIFYQNWKKISLKLSLFRNYVKTGFC